jgi:hypothetical protein
MFDGGYIRMKKTKVFVMRLSEKEEAELKEISKTIQRSKSGTLRYALSEIARVIRAHPNKAHLIKTIRAS